MSKKFRRIALVVLSVVALLLIAGFLFARFWLDGYIKDRLVSAVDQGSRQMYALQVDQLHVNVFTGTAKVNGMHLMTDSLRWEERRQAEPGTTPQRMDLKIANIAVRYFNWRRYWQDKQLVFSSIEITDPEISLQSVQDSVLADDPKADSIKLRILDRLPQMLAPIAKGLEIGSIEVYNGKMLLHAVNPRGTNSMQADSIDMVVSRLNIQTQDTMQNGRALYADNIMFTIRNYEVWPPGSVYAYRFKSATIMAGDSLVKIAGVSVMPTIPDGEFMQRFKIRKPRLRAQAKEVLVRKLNLFRALHKNEWDMESVALDGVDINIYQNKNIPPKLNKSMPNELFRDIQTYLNVDTLVMRNAHLLYKEVVEDGKGLLEFDHINGLILNVTNDPLKMSDSTPA
ncbi:MAG: hypothetical protein ABIO24_11530, partial [Saprospiraceae bacterium]